MSRNTVVNQMNQQELMRLLDDVPADLRLDIVQFALDLVGIVHPAADAANAFISLLRGDLLGTAIGVVSIIPVGDAAKLLKFEKHRKSLVRLVDLAKENPRLARAIAEPMRQVRDMLQNVSGVVGGAGQSASGWFRELDLMRATLDDYFDHLRRVQSIAGRGASWVARQKGRSTGQFAVELGSKRLTFNVNQFVNLLDETIKGGRHPAAKRDAKELLDRMAMAKNEWKVTAGPHAAKDPGSNTKDLTKHITVKIDDKASYHVRLDKQGHLFQVTELVKKRVNGRDVEVSQPLSGIDPWVSPGTPIDR